MKKNEENVVQVPVAGVISGAGETEAAAPTPEVPADQTVETAPIPSDNLNEAVGEEVATMDGDMASEEPLAGSEEAGATEDIPEVSKLPDEDPVTPEPVERVYSRTLTGEEIQEAQQAQEAEAAMPVDKDVQALMENPVVQEVTPLAQAALGQRRAISVILAMYFARVTKAIDEKSFRVWVQKVLQMDEKMAYALRSIGVVFWPLVLKHLVTNNYLSGLGISRLLTIARFPEKTWWVDQEGHVMVKLGEADRHVAELSVDELRKLLATIKAAQAKQQASTLQLWLQTIEAKCTTGMLPEFEIEVEPIKDMLLPKVQEWTDEVTQAIVSNTEKQDALFKEYQKKIANMKAEKEALKAEQTKAGWWLDLLEGRGNDLPPEFQQNATRILEDAADLERRKIAKLTASRTKKRS